MPLVMDISLLGSCEVGTTSRLTARRMENALIGASGYHSLAAFHKRDSIGKAASLPSSVQVFPVQSLRLQRKLLPEQRDRRGFRPWSLFAWKADKGSGGTKLPPKGYPCENAPLAGLIFVPTWCRHSVAALPRISVAGHSGSDQKANDVDISQCVVTCKSEMEKIREQIQNIE